MSVLPPDPATPDARVVVLPARFIDVVAEHGLGGVEAMLLLHLVIRWPAESFGCGTIMHLDAPRAGRALGVCSVAIDAAASRLSARGLILVELFRGRRHVRLAPLRSEVGDLWPTASDEGARDLPYLAIVRVCTCASRGRDALLLLALLMRSPTMASHVSVTASQLAAVVGVETRSAQRMIARLVRRGVLRRVHGGLDLSALLEPEGGAHLAPTNGRYVARLAELLGGDVGDQAQ